MFVKEAGIIEKHWKLRFKDKNIADVLNMTVDEGCDYFLEYTFCKNKT